jgi:hypothetical protein
MENLEFQMNTHLDAVYYNDNQLFRIHIVDVTLSAPKHRLTKVNGRLHWRDDSRVTNLEYHCLSVYSDGTVLFTNMKLKNNSVVRTMFSIFAQYMTKGAI